MTRSTSGFCASANPPSPSWASTTSCPSRRRFRRSPSAMARSSSMTSTRATDRFLPHIETGESFFFSPDLMDDSWRQLQLFLLRRWHYRHLLLENADEDGSGSDVRRHVADAGVQRTVVHGAPLAIPDSSDRG